MRTLMLSLDNHILDPGSRVAARMVEFGMQSELDIIIPATQNKEVSLSESVRVFGTGGSKWQQFFRLMRISKDLQKKNSYDLITTQDPFLLGLVGLLSKKKDTKLEIQLHGDFFSTEYYRHSGLKNWIYYWLARFVLPRADSVRVVGERIKQSVLRLGISEDKIVVRPVVLEIPENIQPDLELRKKYSDKRIFLVLGRLHTVKNIAWLIKRLAALPQKDWHLLIVGEGEEKKHLESLAKKLHLEDEITFWPWTKEPFVVLKTADCLLFPSLSEGYGLVPMEAVALGCPVIMNDVGVAGYELNGPLVTVIPVSRPSDWERALENQSKRTL
ncbi:MAG: glycosyltransferase [Candidatus Magasanikbacteria bacterium]|nr:glycosyltransferase [Candidatus Magasanikbacteria bacterium]